MKRNILIALVIGVMACSAFAADYTWRGTNTQSLYDLLGDGTWDLTPYSNANTADYSGYSLWETGGTPGGVPGADDTADFYWNTTQTNVWSVNSSPDPAPVVIDGSFDVAHMIIRTTAWNHPCRGTDAWVSVQKDLSIEDVYLQFGYSSSGQGLQNLRVETGYTLTLTGSNPVSFGGQRGGWGSFTVDGTLEFSGVAQTLDSFNYSYFTNGSGNVDFTNSSGTLTLADPGFSTYANMYIGTSTTLRLDPGLTVSNPTGTGYVRVQSTVDKNIVESIGGGSLDNADGLAIYMTRGTMNNYSNYLPAGEYQSLHFYNDNSYTRTINVKQTGNVTLQGGTVTAGNGTDVATAQTDYSLYIENGRAMRTYYDLDGNDLTTVRGVRLNATNPNSATNAYSRLYVRTGTVDIGGDLLLESDKYLPGDVDGETRSVGVTIDAGGAIILRGDFITKVRSLSGLPGFTEATMSLIGGVGDPNQFEVGSDVIDTIAAGTYGIDVLNVGSASEAADILLVNNYLNDNTSGDKTGEVVLADTLNIDANSTLDLGGLGAKVASALSIDATGTLDLNTGLTLNNGDVVTAFFGVGDQSAAWAAYQASVEDSDNPSFAFIPTYSVGDDATYWQAVAVPEPATLGLLGVGALALIRKRRK